MQSPIPDPASEPSATKVVRYRIGLNPVQKACRDFIEDMPDEAVVEFLDAFYECFPTFKPVYPRGGVEAMLARPGEVYFTLNDIVGHTGLHPDTVDKYLHAYIGVFVGAPNYKHDRMTLAHPDAPWAEEFAKRFPNTLPLPLPLPLRLVTGRSLAFIVMAPVSVYRPTTGDAELMARWQRLVDFRNEAPSRFGIPKGTPKTIGADVPTTKSVHARRPRNPLYEDPMPIPSLFSLPPVGASSDEPDEVEATPETFATDPKVVVVAPEAAKPDPVQEADDYFTAVADLRARAVRLRGLLDLLPTQEVEQRVADYFRAGLVLLDKAVAR